jgi:streptomycin 6-kinase
VALAFAAARRAAFAPHTAVLAHGDAHAGNLLLASAEGEPRRYKFVDPEGLFIERAYDLAIPMREWGTELLEGNPLALGHRRCALLARLTGVEPEAIWQWGFIERVSTGLHLRELGWEAESREYLAVAEAWAAAEPHG